MYGFLCRSFARKLCAEVVPTAVPTVRSSALPRVLEFKLEWLKLTTRYHNTSTFDHKFADDHRQNILNIREDQDSMTIERGKPNVLSIDLLIYWSAHSVTMSGIAGARQVRRQRRRPQSAVSTRRRPPSSISSSSSSNRHQLSESNKKNRMAADHLGRGHRLLLRHVVVNHKDHQHKSCAVNC